MTFFTGVVLLINIPICVVSMNAVELKAGGGARSMIDGNLRAFWVLNKKEEALSVINPAPTQSENIVFQY